MSLPWSRVSRGTSFTYKDKPVRRKWSLQRPALRLDKAYKRVILMLLCCAGIWLLFARDWKYKDTLNGFYTSYESDAYTVDERLIKSRFSQSVKAAGRPRGLLGVHNTLFVLEDLTSVDANLVQLACRMVRNPTSQTAVHILILGSGSLDIGTYRRIHALNEQECPITFHDGRASVSDVQTKGLQALVSYSFNHVKLAIKHLPPNVILYSHSRQSPKPEYFLHAMRHATDHITRIALAPEGIRQLGWLALLSPRALRSWHLPRIQIFVNCHNSLQLGNLFTSLLHTDYGDADDRPLLQLTLSPDVSVTTIQAAMNMVSAWPKDLLSVRKLLRTSPLGFLEETYPLDKSTFTVLLPEDAELSKHWYMYTKYMVLRYVMSEGDELSRASHTYGLALEPCQPIGDVAGHSAETNEPFHLSASAIGSPMVLFPSALRQLHKTVQDDLAAGISADAINLGEVHERILEHTRDTLLCPPSFQAESTRQTALAKTLDMIDDAAVSDRLSAPPLDKVDLLADETWWEHMGISDSHALSDWKSLALFNSDGHRQTMQDFWPEKSS